MDISNTLKKVNKSLDLRFEQDSSLYISKEDTERIKEALYNARFQNINAFIKKFGNKIVVKIILNNSWLIDFNRNKRELKNIFDGVDTKFLKNISTGIIKDEIFSTSKFKLFIKQYYLEGIPLKDCHKTYKDTQELIQSRITCFKRYLKEEYILENSSSNIVRFIDNELNSYPEIYNYIQTKNGNFLKFVFSDYTDIDHIIKWIITNKITNRKDKIWNNLFLSSKSIALKESVEYISSNPSWDDNITKYLIQRILVKLNRVDVFVEEIEELYNDNFKIRLLFLHMIEPPRFENKNLAQVILDRFEKIGLPNKSEGSVEKIRNWNKFSSFKQGFENRDEMIKSINSSNQDLRNLKTLEYYFFKLMKTKKEVMLDAYYNFSSDRNLKLILSYYLAKFLVKRAIPNHFKEINNSEYVDEITCFVMMLNINTSFSKKFLEDNHKYEEISGFNRR